MPFSPSDSQIFAPLFGDDELAAIFSDAQLARYLLRIEGALARVQGALDIIPRGAAATIVKASGEMDPNLAELRAGIQHDGFPIISLLKQLREQVGEDAAPYVHWGATTQDIMDTALVLQLRDALAPIRERVQHVIRALASLAERHRSTLMAGRTHSQQALPITFGFQVATWLAPLLRDDQRLTELTPRVLVVQFGGAVGTLAALNENGIRVHEALARELELDVPLMPWHTQRDSLAELAGWLSLVSAGLAKMAQDVILLAQSEVGEVRESGDASRGSSSTMPQKSNPIVSELVIAAARANAALLSNMHHALIQEHQRGTHGWQLEWLTLPQMVANTGAALNHVLYVSENLKVDVVRMAENVRASNGLMLAESLTFALAEVMPRAEARQLVAQAVQTAVADKRNLVDVVRERTSARLDWDTLREESNYLGSAQAFIDRVLRAVI